METQLFKKHIFFQDESCKVDIDELNRFVYIHCEVYQWKLSTLKKLYKIIASILEYSRNKGIIGVYTITPNPKFAKMLGGYLVGFIKQDGKEYEVIKWDLKQPHML